MDKPEYTYVKWTLAVIVIIAGYFAIDYFF